MRIPLLDVPAVTTVPDWNWQSNGTFSIVAIGAVVLVVAAIVILVFLTNRRTRNGSHRNDSSVDGGKS